MTKPAKKRVVIVGLGDSGLLAAVRLSQHYAVTAITTKPSFVSGQELGLRVSNPALWRQEYLLPFSAYRRLDQVRIIHGKATAIDSTQQTVRVAGNDGTERTIAYDALLIASGTSNGFWRDDKVQQQAAIDAQLEGHAQQFSRAQRIAIVGGGPTGVSSAANLASRYPDKTIHLFYAQREPLPGYHPRVRRRLKRLLRHRRVHLHAHQRVELADNQRCDRLEARTLTFADQRPPFQADLVLWAVGRITANSAYIDPAMLNTEGFVATDARLRVTGQTTIFAVGDIAATDPQRTSARNGGAQLVSHNIDCLLRGREQKMKSYRAPRYRWGSIIGLQANGLTIYDQRGSQFRFPTWAVKNIVFPCIVRRGIYRGVRPQTTLQVNTERGCAAPSPRQSLS
jgi:NADH dehydrogenase FAD-containing subunit